MGNRAYEGGEFVGKFLDNPSAFFKGEKGFFILDRDWGVHRYYPSMVKMLGFVSRGELSIADLEKGLDSFINQLNSVDIEYLSANAFYFYYVNENDCLGIKDIFSSSEKVIDVTTMYLRRSEEQIASDHYCTEILNCYSNTGLGCILKTIVNE